MRIIRWARYLLLAYGYLLVETLGDSDRVAFAEFQVRSITIRDQGTGDLIDTNNDLSDEFFNLARCTCGYPVDIEFEFVTDLADNDSYVIMAGPDCLDSDGELLERCKALGETSLLPSQAAGVAINQQTDVNRTIAGVSLAELIPDACDQASGTSAITVYARRNGRFEAVPYVATATPITSGLDSSTTTNDAGSSATNTFSFPLDGRAPQAPSGGSISPGEGKLQVNIEAVEESSITYQLLCERAAGSNGDAGGGGPIPWRDGANIIAPAYTTVETIEAAQGTSPALDLCPDAAPGSDPLRTRLFGDPRYNCSSERTSGDDIEIGGLTNGTEYTVYAVAVDAFGNASEIKLIGKGTPLPSESFWERYRNSGGEPSSCRLNSAANPLGNLLLVGLLIFGFGLRWRTRRRAGHDRLRGSRSGERRADEQ